MMDFRSDNVAGVAPEIMAALAAANIGTATAYGEDEASRKLTQRFGEVFETEVAVFAVVTGSAANALALSTMTPPYGAIYCHALSHINIDECAGPELFTGGAKLIDLPGADGKLAPEAVEAALEGFVGDYHRVQPAAVSLTQVTECGTLYTIEEVEAFGALCRRHGLKLHMDGTRFANAVAALGCKPADITWRAGVDALSFGATKNGAMAAEAVVFFDTALARSFGFLRKRAGQLLSKGRFLATQLEAYLQDDLWLRHARHANAIAGRLAQGLATIPGVRLAFPVQANELFVELPEGAVAALEAAGARFARWETGRDGRVVIRLVTAFNSEPAAVDAFLAATRRAMAAPARAAQ
jgi:threonine aldolase